MNTKTSTLSCNRFEEEAMLLIEQGKDLSDHFHECDDCVVARRKYESLAKLLASQVINQPNESWKDEVRKKMKAIKKRSGRKSSSSGKSKVKDKTSSHGRKPTIPWYGSLAASVAVIAITAGIFSKSFFSTQSGSQSLAVSVISSEQNYRGTDAKIGDKLNLELKVNDPENIVVRLYLDGQPYFSCGATQACNLVDKKLSTPIKISALGQYQAVVFMNKKAADKTELPYISIDHDVLAASDIGTEVLISDPIKVR